jgi:6-methylsalicylate decarboxylase
MGQPAHAPLPPRGPLQWTPEQSIAEMDRNGVATAITSLSDPGVWSGDVARSRSVARYCNDYAARLARDYPGRRSLAQEIDLRPE